MSKYTTQYKKSTKSLHDLIGEGYDIKAYQRIGPSESTSGTFEAIYILQKGQSAYEC